MSYTLIKCGIVYLQLQSQVEELRTDANRERKLRERAEEYSQEIELEVETLKKQAGKESSMASLELSQEISRLEWTVTGKEFDFILFQILYL